MRVIAGLQCLREAVEDFLRGCVRVCLRDSPPVASRTISHKTNRAVRPGHAASIPNFRSNVTTKNDADQGILEVYSWPTLNGHPVHAMLEECGLPYRAIPIDISAGDPFKPDVLRISPNNKNPPSLIGMGPTANRYRCLSRVPSCFTWRPRHPGFYPLTTRVSDLKFCSG